MRILSFFNSEGKRVKKQNRYRQNRIQKNIDTP